MRSSFVIASMAAFAPATLATSTVCSSLIYKIFLPLSNYPPAETFCTSRYPVAPVTVTVTAPATTVPTTVSTQTLPTTVSTATITTTNVVSTQTTLLTVTTITTTAIPQKIKRATTTTAPTTTSTKSTSSSTSATITTGGALLSALSSQATSYISTLCSCIETPITKTVTTTPTSYSSVTATTYTPVTASTTETTAVTTTTTASTTAYTTPPQPTLCGNAGMQWAWYPSGSTPDYSTWDPTVSKNAQPGGTGVTNQGYISVTTYSGGNSIYSQSVPQSSLIVEQRGYFYATETGFHTFTAQGIDDELFMWLGPEAYSGWNAGNAKIFTYFSGNSGAGYQGYAVQLTAGNYYPLRLSWKNSNGPGTMYFDVETPSGNTLLGPGGGPSINVVTQSCDGQAAPPYAPFGAET